MPTGLVGISGSFGVNSPKGRITPPPQPIEGVAFRLTGYLPTTVQRPVTLMEVRRHGSRPEAGRLIARGKATRLGRFTISEVRLKRPTKVQVVAPAITKAGHGRLPRLVTRPLLIKPMRQWADLTTLPPADQPGPTPAAPATGTRLMVAFSPLAPGRAMHLEQRRGSRWVTVAKGRQDFNGYGRFWVTPGQRYRVVAVRNAYLREYTTRPVTARGWRTTFEDRFDGDALSTAWGDRVVPASEQSRRTCASTSPDLRTVSGGVLNLRVGLDPTRAAERCNYVSDGVPGVAPWYLSSQLDTRQSYSFTYGVAAARVKFQRQRGMHTSFWLLPSNGMTPLRPDRGTEIDVVEYFGADTLGGGVGAFVHWMDGAGGIETLGADYEFTSTLIDQDDDWWSRFHVFSVEWTPERYVFRIDGQEVWKFDHNVSQSPQFLVLSMMPSDYELEFIDPATLTQPAQVDWVKVWQRDRSSER